MAVTKPLLAHKINSPADIPPQDVHAGITRILALPEGHTRDVMLGSVLTGLLLRGPRLEEIEAAVQAATSLDRSNWDFHQPPGGMRFVGYTGSGKKTFKTINLSTAAALVAATGGAHVAKLGSRSASSKTGSRDFIDLVGATSDMVPHQEMVDITAETGFGFFSIENRVPEFDRRYGGRFQVVHALSLAFPALLSPVACSAYVYGLSHPAVGASARLLRLYAMWHLIAFRGLRRGEACGQPWSETNLDTHFLTVSSQLVQDGWEVEASDPKTDSGSRVVALDDDTVDVLKHHRERQETAREEWGTAWVETGHVFTQEDGSWLHPGKVTDLFERLVAASGLPPIRLHDLRHGAATLMLAADIDIKIVSDTLGHSDTRITRDIYQSVLPHVGKNAAEATAKLVPLQRKAEAEKAARKAAKKEKARKAAAKAADVGKGSKGGGKPKGDKVKAQTKAAKKATRRKPTK
ncbi:MULTISPECIES: tyrosine-type recombinase/integrase [unclassified Streptomyces]|uniref:tyrosine-type recombinase/integrase n=1 Tax=unclassified Streptomyces TaxID=2593676 RepID=UPI0033A1BFC2